MKILIADDHEVFRDGLWLIAAQGFPDMGLQEARSWQGVKDALTRHHDIVMVAIGADLKGQDLTDAVAELAAMPQPVATIIFSDKTPIEDCQRLMAAGARAVIDKGSPRHLIITILHLVMAGGLYVPGAILAESLTGNARLADAGAYNLPDLTLPGLSAGSQLQGKGMTLSPAMQSKLTRRQQDIARLLAEGKSNAMIASDLGIAEGTVRIHVSAVLRALEVSNRSQVAAMAARGDLMDHG